MQETAIERHEVLLIDDYIEITKMLADFIDMTAPKLQGVSLDPKDLPVEKLVAQINAHHNAVAAILDGELWGYTAVELISALNEINTRLVLVLFTGSPEVLKAVRETHPEIPAFLKNDPSTSVSDIIGEIKAGIEKNAARQKAA